MKALLRELSGRWGCVLCNMKGEPLLLFMDSEEASDFCLANKIMWRME